MAQVFDALGTLEILEPAVAARLSRTVGFRTVAVHEYERIDWRIVFSIVSDQLDDFRRFADAVRASL